MNLSGIKITIIAVVIIAVVTNFAVAQSQTQWLTSQAREMNFPNETYISGFAPANVRSGETQSAACLRAGREAAKLASSSIRTMIENTVETATQEIDLNGNYDIASIYSDYTKQTSTAEIAGLKTETYFNATENIAYGFAYVKRSELIAYYKSQINLNIKKIEDAISLSNSAAVSGQKMKAKKYCQNAIENLTKVDFAQGLLSAVSPSDNAGLQSDRYSSVKKQLFQQLIDLEQSIYIYLKCTESNFGSPTTILANQLKSILANNECSFTTDPAQADYKITLVATTRKHDVDNPDFKFTYADVQIDLFSSYKNLSVYNDEISVKGGATTFETAGKTALKDASKVIWTKIETWIKK